MLLDRGVDFLHAAEHFLHLAEEALCVFVVVFQEAGGKRDHQTDFLQGAGGLGEFLEEGLRLGGQVAFADGNPRGFRGVGEDFVHEDEDGLVRGQQGANGLPARRGLALEAGTGAGQLLGHDAPQGVLLRVQDGAHEHHGVSLPFPSLVVHGDERVGLAATEGGLHLDDRIATLSVQALFHHGQQVRQALGGIRLLEEALGVLIFVRRATLEHFPQVRGEHIHGQTAFQDVIVRNGYHVERPHHLSCLLLFRGDDFAGVLQGGPVVLYVLHCFLGIQGARGGADADVKFLALRALEKHRLRGSLYFNHVDEFVLHLFKPPPNQGGILSSQVVAEQAGQELLEPVARVSHQRQVRVQPQDAAVVLDADDQGATVGVEKGGDGFQYLVSERGVLLALAHIPLQTALEFNGLALAAGNQVLDVHKLSLPLRPVHLNIFHRLLGIQGSRRRAHANVEFLALGPFEENGFRCFFYFDHIDQLAVHFLKSTSNQVVVLGPNGVRDEVGQELLKAIR